MRRQPIRLYRLLRPVVSSTLTPVYTWIHLPCLDLPPVSRMQRQTFVSHIDDWTGWLLQRAFSNAFYWMKTSVWVKLSLKFVPKVSNLNMRRLFWVRCLTLYGVAWLLLVFSLTGLSFWTHSLNMYLIIRYEQNKCILVNMLCSIWWAIAITNTYLLTIFYLSRYVQCRQYHNQLLWCIHTSVN